MMRVSPQALNAFNAGDVHLHAAQDGLTRATEQYVKDIRVRNFNSYICQYPLILKIVKLTDLRIICNAGSYREEYPPSQELQECKAQLEAALAAAGGATETPSGNYSEKKSSL